jgi:very-short-patch-repair endonuclease
MNSNSPFYKAQSLLTPGESAFYPALLEAVAGRWQVQVKPRLEDVVGVMENIPNRQSYRNQVMSKHVDFLLCMPDTLATVLVIELDDPSHERPDRKRRDEQVDSILQSAGLPILHVPTRASYDSALLERDILEKIASPTASHSAPTMPLVAGPPQKNTTTLSRPRKQQSKGKNMGMGLLRVIISTALTILIAVLLWMGVISALRSVGTASRTTALPATADATATAIAPGGARQGDDAIVATANLNMRSGPGRDLPIVGTYPEGTALKVLGKDPTDYWLKVMAPNGKTGWMSGRFLKLSVQLSDVPVTDK